MARGESPPLECWLAVRGAETAYICSYRDGNVLCQKGGRGTSTSESSTEREMSSLSESQSNMRKGASASLQREISCCSSLQGVAHRETFPAAPLSRLYYTERNVLLLLSAGCSTEINVICYTGGRGTDDRASGRGSTFGLTVTSENMTGRVRGSTIGACSLSPIKPFSVINVLFTILNWVV